MTTEKQIQANRENAKKSTGPKTPEGKANSRCNALKHGLRGEKLLMPEDMPEDYQDLKDGIDEEYQPQTASEEFQAGRIAMLTWRLDRASRIDVGMLQLSRLEMPRHPNHDQAMAEIGKGPWLLNGADVELSMAFANRMRSLGNVSRYERHIDLSLSRARREMERLQKDRRARELRKYKNQQAAAVYEQVMEIEQQQQAQWAKGGNPRAGEAVDEIFEKPKSGSGSEAKKKVWYSSTPGVLYGSAPKTKNVEDDPVVEADPGK